MAMTVEDTATLRETISKLDLSKTDDVETYNNLRDEYIKASEGTRQQAYDDSTGKSVENGTLPKGNVTVGVGFNMGSEAGKARKKQARTEWDAAFKDDAAKPDFDNVYSGKTALDDKQVATLLKSTLNDREARVAKTYGNSWGQMSPEQRLATTDMFFNAETLATNNHYQTDMTAAVGAGTAEEKAAALNAAIWEVKFNSNSANSNGQQNRRDSNTALLTNATNEDLNKLQRPGNDPAPQPKTANQSAPVNDNPHGLNDDHQQAIEQIRQNMGGRLAVQNPDRPAAPQNYITPGAQQIQH